MIQAKFGLNWPSGFREDFLFFSQTDDGRQVMAIAHTGKLKIVIKMAILRKPEKTTDLSQVTDKLYRVHLVVNVIRTHNVSSDSH
jgi:hypothetical protein